MKLAERSIRYVAPLVSLGEAPLGPRGLPAPGMTIKLSPREADVLRLVARGYTYARAAERLGLSAHTVASHIKKIYRKLGVHSAGAAVMRAVKLGFIE